MMKASRFLCNENIPRASVELLLSEDMDVTWVAASQAGITDREVIQTAIMEQRIIITLDRDYGELIFRHGQTLKTGVIYLRFVEYDPEMPARLILNALKDSSLTFSGKFTVIDHNGIRQRNL